MNIPLVVPKLTHRHVVVISAGLLLGALAWCTTSASEAPGSQGVLPAASWDSFWKDFLTAVHKRDRNALRAMMAEHFEFGEVGAGMETPETAFAAWDRDNAWKALARVISKGAVKATLPKEWGLKGEVKIAPPEAADGHSSDWFAIFQQDKEGRWRFDSFVNGVGD